jgi:hypothetical protein
MSLKPKVSRLAASRTTTYAFRFSRVERSDSEWNERINPGDRLFWEGEGTTIPALTYEHDGCKAEVSADWSVYAKAAINALDVHKRVADITASGGQVDVSIFDELEPVQMACSIRLAGANELSKYEWYPEIFATRYAYDVFTIFNLARPGVLDALNLSIAKRRDPPKDKLRLSSYGFEDCYFEFQRSKWPPLRTLPMLRVHDWYLRQRLGISQKAETSVSKAIYSLLRLCHLEIDVTSVIWIFHALEALFGTRVGEGFTNLHSRMSALLKLSDNDRVTLRKQLRALYDLRNSVVHGGFETFHPTERTVLDKGIDEKMDDINTLSLGGHGLILCCLQELIARDWIGVRFDENPRESDGTSIKK